MPLQFLKEQLGTKSAPCTFAMKEIDKFGVMWSRKASCRQHPQCPTLCCPPAVLDGAI